MHLKIFLCVAVYCPLVRLCILNLPVACRSELELELAVSCHEGAGNTTWVLCKSNRCTYLLSQLFSLFDHSC